MWQRICFLVVAFTILFGPGAQAVGVGVKPKAIDLEIKTGQKKETDFLVINISKIPAIYQVYTDGLEENVKLRPNHFRLEAGSSQIVELQASINSPGLFGTNISVVARPLGAGGLTAASGVKLPLTIKATGISAWRLVTIVLVCLGLIFVVILINKSKSKKRNSLVHKPKFL